MAKILNLVHGNIIRDILYSQFVIPKEFINILTWTYWFIFAARMYPFRFVISVTDEKTRSEFLILLKLK